MLTISHRALAAIAGGEISVAGAASMANLAMEALREVESIAEGKGKEPSAERISPKDRK
jgi:hypothetical protein